MKPLAAYLVITAVMTWPLAGGLTTRVAWDLGDPVFSMWVLAWDGTQIQAILGGELSRLSTFFNANIFYPEPNTLAYSEHLIGQALQIFPVYAFTKNAILSYNLLFLSTFVLSGYGAFLFVRELTGSARAAFVAGLLYAFAPYRLSQASHLQVLSSHWMPFVLYGLRRYFDTGRRAPLAGAAAAAVMQNLSSGYFLLYFTPFAIGYVLWEIGARKIWRKEQTWRDLSIAALFVVACTVPFLFPYQYVRNRLGGGRRLPEIIRFSADVWGYVTAAENQRVWSGVLRVFPKLEGDLFPGLVPMGLSLGAVAIALRARISRPRLLREWIAAFFLLIGAAHVALAVAAIYLRRVEIDLGVVTISAGNITRLLGLAACAVVLATVASPRVRAAAAALARLPETFFVAMVVAAWWLSLGPEPATLGRPLELASPYAVLADNVPGFEGTRVPARLAMLVALALALLSGFALLAIDRMRGGRVLLAATALLFLWEAHVMPMPVSELPKAPPVYAAVRPLPADAVILELPFGEVVGDLKAMYYSAEHWRPLVNGYSGFFPPDWGRYNAVFTDIPRHPELSLDGLRQTGATHAIVHERAYPGSEGPEITAWLRRAGAVEVFRDGSDVLLAVRR